MHTIPAPPATIPQITDMIRHHVNTDNDARRLIAEEVLPILGLPSLKEIEDLKGEIEALEERIEELENTDEGE